MQHTDQGTHIVKICAIIILHQCHINRLYFFNEKNSFKNITEIMINFSVCNVYMSNKPRKEYVLLGSMLKIIFQTTCKYSPMYLPWLWYINKAINISDFVLYLYVCIQVRAPQGSEPKIRAFDAEHERKRKLQLTKLFDRTPEQVGVDVLVHLYWSQLFV